jgi:hypothetical protein
MPQELSESVSGSIELVFPDDASGMKYRLRERSVYDAEEVRNELGGDMPKFGDWLPVTIRHSDGDEEGWLIAPSDLRRQLVEENVGPNEDFLIRAMNKAGSQQSDPYRVDLVIPDRD